MIVEGGGKAKTKRGEAKRLREQGLKRCPWCGEVKSLDDFPNYSKSLDGKFTYCKTCMQERAKRPEESIPKRKPPRQSQAERAALLAQGLKMCSKCQIVKPINEFAADSRHADGLQSRCRECCNSSRRNEYGNVVRASSVQYYWDNRTPETLAKKCEREKRNRERTKERCKRKWQEHPEIRMKYLNQRKAHHEKYRERDNADAIVRAKKWRENNPDKFRENLRRREERINNLPGEFTEPQFRTLTELCGGHCVLYDPDFCNEERGMERDHIIPATWPGSTNYIDNIQPMCKKHNRRKHNREAVDYRPVAAVKWSQQETRRQKAIDSGQKPDIMDSSMEGEER